MSADEPDEATVLARRESAVWTPDEETVLVRREAPDEATVLVRREAPDEETVLVRRDAPAEETVLARRAPVDDETRLSVRAQAAASVVAAPAAPAPPAASPPGRIAHIPGAETESARYGAREVVSEVPIARSPVAAALSPHAAHAAETVVLASRRKSRRSGIVTISVVLGVTLVAIAAVVALILVLSTV